MCLSVRDSHERRLWKTAVIPIGRLTGKHQGGQEAEGQARRDHAFMGDSMVKDRVTGIGLASWDTSNRL